MANSPARVPVDVGSVIAETYRIEALLGRGGMGSVFLASHQRLAGKQVAIKILHTELEDGDVIARFKREAEIAARLNHPNIVGVVDYNVAADGTPYLVLDYLEGETLAQRIARGPLPLDQVMSILRQVGSALAAAHRAGIVHRDLKPQNIFLVPSEVDGRHVEIAKVLDFGISKIRGSQTVKTQDSALLGTPQYMAPEQATGQHASVDERTDVFALGAIVHEMLSGEPAFSGASIPEVMFKVVYEQPAPLTAQPPAVVAAVTRAMAKPADERFPTVAAFVEAVTGQPLTLSRGQALATATANDSPSALRRAASGEAFAQTMGSGDHGDSPIAATAAGAAATLPPSTSRSTAAPIDDRSRAPDPAYPAGPARRSTGVIIALAIAGAAVAAVAVYVVARGPGSTKTHRPEVASIEPRNAPAAGAPAATTAVAPPPAAPAAAPAAAAAPSSAATQIAESDGTAAKSAGSAKTVASTATRTAGAGKATATGKPAFGDRAEQVAAVTTEHRPHTASPPPGAPPPGAHAAVPTAASADTDGDEDTRDKLKQANAALDARNYDLAERLANSVINSPATPKQRAAARVIHGTVQCIARNDQEAAQIDLRNLVGFRAMHARLLTVCRNHGILNGP
jgi:serine/threonine-protein kinase